MHHYTIIIFYFMYSFCIFHILLRDPYLTCFLSTTFLIYSFFKFCNSSMRDCEGLKVLIEKLIND